MQRSVFQFLFSALFCKKEYQKNNMIVSAYFLAAMYVITKITLRNLLWYWINPSVWSNFVIFHICFAEEVHWSVSESDSFFEILLQIFRFYNSKQCCGSVIRCLFDPWIRDPGWVKVRIRIRNTDSKRSISNVTWSLELDDNELGSNYYKINVLNTTK